MTPERWQAVQAVFAAALETPMPDRESRLQELCAGDAELYREVQTLLVADAGASAVVAPPAAALASAVGHAGETVPVGARVGEYVIRSLLGRGGMGIVYAGIHPVIEKEVAIKVLDPRLASSGAIVERFVREARAVNRIRHPNIIDIFAFGHSPELGHYFVMPRLVGETLGERIARGPFSLPELLPIVEQIADALDAAHGAGVLHRDLKPDNVFLVADRRGYHVQILDFGIAKLLDSEVSVTRSGMQMGTPLFMSPEQWDARGVDRRTDVYALGVMIHHALTGRYPFESSSTVALMNMHANRPPTPPSEHGAPTAVDPVLARALAKNPEDRQGSAGQVYAELAAIAGSAATSVPPRSAPVLPAAHTTLSGSIGSSEQPPTRSRIGFGLGLLGLAAVGVVVAFALVMSSDRHAAGAPAIPDAAAPIDTATAAAAVEPPPAPDAAVDAPPPRTLAPDARPRTRHAAVAPVAAFAPDAAVVPDATAPLPVATAPLPVAHPATTPRDAGVRRDDASAWGSTINPFGDPP